MWSNTQSQLCYACESCKIGVFKGIRKRWRILLVFNLLVTLLVVAKSILLSLFTYHNSGCYILVSASFQLAPGGYPIKQALPKLFVISFRKYMQAANETATYKYKIQYLNLKPSVKRIIRWMKVLQLVSGGPIAAIMKLSDTSSSPESPDDVTSHSFCYMDSSD
ncbi:unnamed protein product [Brassica rapa]|uniref:Uncharacterized protein n=1 Tax=Brassica campestris TaxID=3711 RepID=A0A3P5ZPK3_BRACM|nr:unnamed protein product [Brassica rapa]VDC82556.1 unnamed protein product [Brassica rapa]